MNETIMKKWTAALRSGKFKQAKRQLKARREDGVLGYCCLGVLCELHRKATGDGEWDYVSDWESKIYLYAATGSEANGSALPGPVREWAGLRDRSPTIDRDSSLPRSAAWMNDEGVSFEEIADKIEHAQQKGWI